MSYADVRIIAIVMVLASTFGVWQLMYAQSTMPSNSQEVIAPNHTAYGNPNPGNIWEIVLKSVSISVSSPEIFFINSIFFFVMIILVIFIMLRFIRGTG